jgi:hypothetical protein
MSLKIVVTQGATQVLNQTANLTPASGGCSSTLASTQCVLTLALAPGTYTAAVTTYDQTNAGGNLLSAGQNVGFTVVPGAANTINLTLSGIPVQYLVAPNSGIITGNAATGFTIAGITAQPQPFTALARDADGNFIVGVGAPAFTFSVTSGAGWSTTNATTTRPNAFTVTSPGNGSTASIKLTAVYSDATCSQTTAVCTATFSVANHAQTLFVANCGAIGCGNGNDSVLVYAPPYTGTPTTITSGINWPVALAVDPSKNLFVSNFQNRTITVYAPPYTGPPVRTVTSVLQPIGILVDAGYNLYEFNYAGGVNEYAAPYTTSFRSIQTNGGAPPMFDQANALFVVDPSGNGIAKLAPPDFQTRTAFVNTAGLPDCFAVGPDDTIYSVFASGRSALISHPPYSSMIITSGNQNPYDVTFDQLGHEFVADGSNDISEWDANGNHLATITNGISYSSTTFSYCAMLATDAGNDLFSLNTGNGSVTVYTPQYSATPVVVTAGFSQLQALFLGP